MSTSPPSPDPRRSTLPQALQRPLHAELQATLRATPGLDALWLGASPGILLGAAGRTTVVRLRLAAEAVSVLRTVERAGPGGNEDAPTFVLLGPREVVLAAPARLPARLLALADPLHLDAAAIDGFCAAAVHFGIRRPSFPSPVTKPLEELA